MQGTLAERACCGGGDRGDLRPRQTRLPCLWVRAQAPVLAHDKFSNFTDLHINRGHYYVGLIKTLCLLVLSWIFTDGFWLRVGPVGLRWRSAGGTQWWVSDSSRIRDGSATVKSPFNLLSVCVCLPDEWSHFHDCGENGMFPLTQIIIFRWSFKLVDFYRSFISSNFLSSK